MIKDSIFMDIAECISKASYCQRAKVGAIIVKDSNIISMGYNGTPSGFENVCECDGKTLPEVLHAESNAITKCAKGDQSCKGATLYVTLSPCFECSKLIIQSGIKEVIYKEAYSGNSGIELLQKAGIFTTQL